MMMMGRKVSIVTAKPQTTNVNPATHGSGRLRQKSFVTNDASRRLPASVCRMLAVTNRPMMGVATTA